MRLALFFLEATSPRAYKHIFIVYLSDTYAFKTTI
jgi:hypothetical protein